MERDYLPLPITQLDSGVAFRLPAQRPSVTLTSPALDVMTDFRQTRAITTHPEATIDEANEKMIEHGVRLLLVVNGSGFVLGVVSAADILGEKPVKLMRELGIKRKEITVSELMSGQDELDVITFESLLGAKVGHVVTTLRRAGRQHALIVELDAQSKRQIVRGLFSASQVARQLGVPVHTTEVARTFAEIEATLGR
ncbi:MAG TPA: CBS domain-containing protein [Burkholderiales bacterium]|nr:CBS domain-containing protein [Burkholderiales bacterium]